jgi:hypothetical protein
MITTIVNYLVTNINTDLGLVAYPSDGLATVQAGETYPFPTLPCLFVVPSRIFQVYDELGINATNSSTQPERQYTVNLAGTVIGANYSTALSRAEVQAKRLDYWCKDNDGLDGLTNGTERVFASPAKPIELQVKGSGTLWYGYFMMPLIVSTEGLT